MQKISKPIDSVSKVIPKVQRLKITNRRTALIIGALAVVTVTVAATGIFLLINQKNIATQAWRKNTVAATRGPVNVRIQATGTIRPINQVKVSPKQTGLLKALYVKQGDHVVAGQLIARMDASNILGQVQAAQGALQAAESNYLKVLHGNRPQEVAVARFQERRAQSGIQAAKQNITRLTAQLASTRANLVRDQRLAERQTLLAQQGAISDQDRLNAVTQAQVSLNSVNAAQQELEQAQSAYNQSKADAQVSTEQRILSTIGSRPEDIAAAKSAVVQAQGNLQYLQSQLNDMEIHAPFAGIITQKYADTGAIVTPTTSAATTSATSSSIVSLAGEVEMVAAVAETDIGKIKLGQPVEVRATAFPDQIFHGTVTQLAPEAVVTQNVTTFEVHTNIQDDKHNQLLSGMNVNAQFLAGQIDNAILVPTVSIVQKRGQTGILIAKPDGTPQFKRVKTGPTVGNKTVITKGIAAGDLVFIGLTKEQLAQQGYANGNLTGGGMGRGGGGFSGGYGGGGGRGGGGGAPIPRGFGR